MNKVQIYSSLNLLQWSLFNLFEKLTGYRKEKKKFRRSVKTELNLKNPLSFQEKIAWKKIYDRNPLLPVVADKYMVRWYLEDVLGKAKAEEILVPLLYVTDKPETIPFDKLPPEYIIKANHASNRNIIIKKSSVVDRERIIAQCKEWLIKPYGLKMHEWAYQKIKRKIVVESLLHDENGNFPTDYKLFTFHGKCHLIQIVYERFGKPSVGYYTPEWKYLDVKGVPNQADYKPRPENLDSMTSLAGILGAQFDFISVDLYLFNDKIYFSELTNYPGAGYFSWTPESYNFELGAKWKIIPGYWKKDDYIQKISVGVYSYANKIIDPSSLK